MSNCVDSRPLVVCFTPSDTSISPVQLLEHIIYDNDGRAVGQAYTLADDSETPIDISTFLGGGSVEAGPCKPKKSQCVKWSSLVTGIDNTGTRFDASYTFLVTLSNGVTFTVDQTPTAGWTAQLNQWVTIFGAEINALFPTAVVEARCNILPGGCGGLLAPPSDVNFNLMYARYMQITACPTDAAPVKVEITASSIASHVGRTLDVEYFRTPERRGYVCYDCGSSPVLYNNDGTLVAPADLPICYFDCAEAYPEVPQSLCSSDFEEAGCDTLNDPDPLNWVPIIRRYTSCDGADPVIEYFIVDNTDPSAPVLADYTLVGEFVDCNSGDPVPEPQPECGQFMGDCRCYGDEESASDYVYVNADNSTDIDFSMNSTTIKWAIQLGQQAEADGTGPFVADCINGGGVATMTITDQDGNVVIFDADAVSQDGTGTGGWVFTGAGPGGFGGKVREVRISCSTSAGATGKACAYRDCESGAITWIDSKTGAVLTEEECSTLRECTIPVTVEPPCDVEILQVQGCAAEDVAGQATTGDLILTVARQDCEGVILESTQYNITTGNTELTEAVLTTDCDPQPDVTQTEECIIDANNVQWAEITIVQGMAITVIYVNQETLSLGTPAGSASEWSSCVEGQFDVECKEVCVNAVQYDGETWIVGPTCNGGPVFYSTSSDRAILDEQTIVGGWAIVVASAIQNCAVEAAGVLPDTPPADPLALDQEQCKIHQHVVYDAVTGMIEDTYYTGLDNVQVVAAVLVKCINQDDTCIDCSDQGVANGVVEVFPFVAEAKAGSTNPDPATIEAALGTTTDLSGLLDGTNTNLPDTGNEDWLARFDLSGLAPDCAVINSLTLEMTATPDGAGWAILVYDGNDPSQEIYTTIAGGDGWTYQQYNASANVLFGGHDFVPANPSPQSAGPGEYTVQVPIDLGTLPADLSNITVASIVVTSGDTIREVKFIADIDGSACPPAEEKKAQRTVIDPDCQTALGPVPVDITNETITVVVQEPTSTELTTSNTLCYPDDDASNIVVEYTQVVELPANVVVASYYTVIAVGTGTLSAGLTVGQQWTPPDLTQLTNCSPGAIPSTDTRDATYCASVDGPDFSEGDVILCRETYDTSVGAIGSGNEVLLFTNYYSANGDVVAAFDPLTQAGPCPVPCECVELQEFCLCIGGVRTPVLARINKEDFTIIDVKSALTFQIVDPSEYVDGFNDCCEECCDETVVSCATARLDYYTLADFVGDGLFPLVWNLNGTDSCGQAFNFDVTTNLDAGWTDASQIYNDLIAGLNTIPGVQAVASTLVGYNGDGAPEIDISIAAGVTLNIVRTYGSPVDTHTISESGGNTTVNTSFSGSPAWYECGTTNDIPSGTTFPNTL